jgi:hypothetical protein
MARATKLAADAQGRANLRRTWVVRALARLKQLLGAILGRIDDGFSELGSRIFDRADRVRAI